jgi:SAM-dependent methyltransferase
MTTTPTDFELLKARLKATWMTGDYGRFAKYFEHLGEEFVARRSIKPEMLLLDVACGTGNVAIPAAKAGARVTGVDIATNWLEQARERGEREGVSVQFDEGDAEQLPYPDASFDLVISLFGAMFAPRPERVAAELVRVCRPGGQIVMGNWTPRGFTGQMFRATSVHVPPSPGVPPVLLWGDEATVRERLRDGISSLQCTHLTASIKLPFSVPETVEFYRLYYGPTQRAFAGLPEDNRPALRHDLESLFAQHNQGTDGTTHFESEYLEVIATRA